MEMKVDVAFHEELDPHSRTAVKSDEGNVVGRGFHESLLRSLLRGEQLESTAFGVTKTRVMTASLNFEDHTARSKSSFKGYTHYEGQCETCSLQGLPCMESFQREAVAERSAGF